jgi:hypothetical protein
MIIPIDYLEVRATALSRPTVRLGLQRLKHRGVAIEWFERDYWWRSVFLVWGHPLLISKLEQTLGHLSTRPCTLHGSNLNIVV